jgi:hypothetical protein
VSSGHPQVPKGRTRAVKILLSDAAYLDELIGYLFTVGCIVEQIGPNLVEVSKLSSVRHDQARMEIDLFLQAWKASHPDVAVRLLD